MINLSDFDEYQEKAMRTMKPDAYLQQVLHCTMGMVGEAGEFKELDWVEADKMIAESGDCMWYAAGMADALSIRLSDIHLDAIAIHEDRLGPFSTKAGEDKALIWACRLTDLVKKSVFYSKELDAAAVRTMLTHYWAALLHVCAKLSVPPMYVATMNIRKLEARFPDKFDASAAIHRNIAAEAAALGAVNA